MLAIFDMLIIALLAEWLCSGLLIRVRKNNVGSNPMECTNDLLAQLAEHNTFKVVGVLGSTPRGITT